MVFFFFSKMLKILPVASSYLGHCMDRYHIGLSQSGKIIAENK